MNDLSTEQREMMATKVINCKERHMHHWELDPKSPFMSMLDLKPKDPVASAMHFLAIEIYLGDKLLMVGLHPEEINHEEFQKRKERSDKVANWFSELSIQRAYKAMMLQLFRSGLMWIGSEQQKAEIIKQQN